MHLPFSFSLALLAFLQPPLDSIQGPHNNLTAQQHPMASNQTHRAMKLQHDKSSLSAVKGIQTMLWQLCQARSTQHLDKQVKVV